MILPGTIGATLFGTECFGGPLARGTVTPVLSMGENLPQAILKRVQDTPALNNRLPGGFWFGPPDEDANENLPYAVLNWIGEQTISYVTGRKSPSDPSGNAIKAGKRTQFQVSLVGEDYDDLDQIHDIWEDNFHPRMDPLNVRRRLFRGLFNSDPTVDIGDTPLSPSTHNTVVIRWDFEVVSNIIPPTEE